jgi:hypothetical protein
VGTSRPRSALPCDERRAMERSSPALPAHAHAERTAGRASGGLLEQRRPMLRSRRYRARAPRGTIRGAREAGASSRRGRARARAPERERSRVAASRAPRSAPSSSSSRRGSCKPRAWGWRSWSPLVRARVAARSCCSPDDPR